jgi:GNAT superfamily N-acetyltransferase
MATDIRIAPMDDEFVVWRCLHGGPLHLGNLGRPAPHPAVDWNRHRRVNTTLLGRIIEAYGTCAMLAWHGDRVVGHIRFYPKVLYDLPEMGQLCLQQAHPAGPADEAIEVELPARADLEDRTIAVHCMMTGSPSRNDNPYQRRGVGRRLAIATVDWARSHGWSAVEAWAHQGLPLQWEITGEAGRSFWEPLGFRVVAEDEPDRLEASYFRAIQEQAAKAGTDPDEAAVRYLMRLELD